MTEGMETSSNKHFVPTDQMICVRCFKDCLSVCLSDNLYLRPQIITLPAIMLSTQGAMFISGFHIFLNRALSDEINADHIMTLTLLTPSVHVDGTRLCFSITWTKSDTGLTVLDSLTLLFKYYFF